MELSVTLEKEVFQKFLLMMSTQVFRNFPFLLSELDGQLKTTPNYSYEYAADEAGWIVGSTNKKFPMVVACRFLMSLLTHKHCYAELPRNKHRVKP